MDGSLSPFLITEGGITACIKIPFNGISLPKRVDRRKDFFV
jgi:hypothetical protein